MLGCSGRRRTAQIHVGIDVVDEIVDLLGEKSGHQLAINSHKGLGKKLDQGDVLITEFMFPQAINEVMHSPTEPMCKEERWRDAEGPSHPQVDGRLARGPAFPFKKGSSKVLEPGAVNTRTRFRVTYVAEWRRS